MGVELLDVAADVQEVLRRTVAEQVRRFEL
jgi:hypothetical protein